MSAVASVDDIDGTSSHSPRREQWLRIAMQDVDRDFIEYDVRGDGNPQYSHINFEYRVRGRSVAECVMAFFDHLSSLPEPVSDVVPDMYDWAGFQIPDDDLEAKRWIRNFTMQNRTIGIRPFTIVQLQLLDEIKDRPVLTVSDMPGTGRKTKGVKQ